MRVEGTWVPILTFEVNRTYQRLVVSSPTDMIDQTLDSAGFYHVAGDNSASIYLWINRLLSKY